MPSSRRLKIVVVGVFTALILVLYYSSSSKSTAPIKHSYEDLKDNVHDRLRQAEQVAKDKANIKAPGPPPQPPHAHHKGDHEDAEGGTPKGAAKQAAFNALDEIDRILKRSPVVIISKSYCPYSQKAKALLMEKYTIVPRPFIVELDLHPHGRELQDAFHKQTGRRTVPNILIQGQSIGGSDDIAALDRTDELDIKIIKLGGKNIRSIEKKT